MNATRSLILNRIRRAHKTGRVPMVQRPAPEPLPVPNTGTTANPVDRFVAELRALGVTSHVVSTGEEVRALVATIVRDRTVFAWDPDRLPYDVGPTLGPEVVLAAGSRDRQVSADIGVTGCHGAIVETGSIAVLSGSGTPRSASLLPPTHLCLVKETDLYPSVGEFLRIRADDVARAACCTFITGPSRTADIELTLTVGVHGPGVVIVIVGP
jgi:L-lactate dehydrogenase complex protein LldG